MRSENPLFDASAGALDGVPAVMGRSACLKSTRSSRMWPERIMRPWGAPWLCQQWQPHPHQARTMPITQCCSSSACATVTDGIRSAHVEMLLVEAGPLTALGPTIAPLGPLTHEMLIHTGDGGRREGPLRAPAVPLTT